MKKDFVEERKGMYYPKQLPYLLDKEFKEKMEYTEYRIKELDSYSMCIWCMKSKMQIEKTIYNYILPDACIDIVIDFTNESICFAGFSKETIPFALQEKIDYMGVRLKPSAFYILFEVEANKIMDQPADFFEIENSDELKNIFKAKDTKERMDIFKTYLGRKMKDKNNKQSIEFVDELYQKPKDQTVLDMASRFGYEKRHLCRIFKKFYGVSPKVLLNIVRLHKCLTLLEKGKTLEDIMNDCGFYDQSHFIKEIKKYTGFSPLELFENGKV